ncbi:Diguanylate cyclase YdeH [Tepidimonas alkaliphilus]|uniref:diguanylate cyclase n=1 Tax=Tepidimonas alkaliphilus TaxID=2588942 RepID=A0A554W8E7_9BURK|nr:GGDEF domain-containing protein [Tepidimonas alkaliphilus]TSE19852.1 Diguanylate cyclase YdeH [Tepidimonas alkaliphilus]
MGSPASTPQEIAREAVRLLAARRLPPTPDNFQAAYHEVAGTRPLQPFPLAQLRQIGQALPERTPAQLRFKTLFNRAVTRHSWDDLEKLLVQHLGAASSPPPPSATPPATAQPPDSAEPAPHADEKAASIPISPDIAEPAARVIDLTLPLVAADDARLREMGEELVRYLRLEQHHAPTLRRMLADYAFRLSFGVDEQLGVREALLGLLRQVLEHIDAISPDNPWLRQQLQALVQAAQPPLSQRRLEDLQARLKDVIVKQAEAREQTVRAQELMRQTLATFLERLAQTAVSTGQYQAKFEACAQALERAQSLADMAPVVQDAIQTARAFATDTQRVVAELTELRDRADRAEAEVQRLRRELDQMAELVTHDLLTGVLNRKGLENAIDRETHRAERTGTRVCIALLDVDDFKRLNDTLGHLAGDAALKHLADVARRSLRPQDTVGRYGGEEFIIVLPDTTPDEAAAVVQRLQRDLSAHLFLHGEQPVLITFSAGVTELRPGEPVANAIARADQAMYRAKRAGKNRVMQA